MTSFGKLFLIIYIPVALVIAVSFYFNYEANLKNIDKQLFHFMREKWVSASALDMEDPASEKTHETIKKAVKGTFSRITVIDKTGKVLNDSAVAYENLPELENHEERDEFRNAALGYPSYEIRKSRSTGKNSVYYAAKTGKGQNAPVLRIAYDAEYLDNLEKSLFTQSSAIAAALMIAVAMISAYLARKFSAPVKDLNAVISNMEKIGGDYRMPIFKDKAFDRVSETIYKMYASLIKEKTDAENGRLKLETVLKAMNEGIILLDKNGETIHVNAKASEYLGIKLAPGRNVIKDCDNAASIVFFKKLADCGEGRNSLKYKEMLFEAYSKKIGEETLIVFAEVTDKLRYEAFKTELVGNLTHEIKTPLTLLMGASETILKDKDMDRELLERFLETIHRNTVKLNGIVNDTLELHKLESQKDAEEITEPAKVKETIEELKTIFQTWGGKEIVYDAPDIEVDIKSEHLSSVLTNLISNAVKYSGGEKIYVEIKKDKRKLRISVADEGPAIPEKERKRIFERFYTVSKSRAKNLSGTGLGLAIVKHITEVYGGKAAVYENDKGGNTFEATMKEKYR